MMSPEPRRQANRLDRRKARTRASLIRAAQALLAAGRTNVPILEITQAADVGMGSFYNGTAACRDITAAVEAGRFHVVDLDVTVTMVAGAFLAIGQLLQDQPDRDVEQTTDQVTEDFLRMFGVPRRQAHHLYTLPLPDIEAVPGDGSAA